MNLIKILSIIEIIISALLAIVILMQQGGGGLGTMFGGTGGESYRSKRGVEAFLMKFTVFLIIIFSLNAIVISILTSAN